MQERYCMLEPQNISPVNAAITEQIKYQSTQFYEIAHEVAKLIVGQQEIIDFILMAILCKGHILLEGVPGLAKTTMIKAVTKALGLKFNRIQFTPDLLPADLIGTLIYNQKTQEFETKKGPIFSNLILADEINRAPAKVQSALLEAMQEQQVTIGSTTFSLQEPFLVFATQNPIEQEGTYRLPEAQIDRFMFKLTITYPSKVEEKELLRRNLSLDSVAQVFSAEKITTAQKLVQEVYIDERIIDYIVTLVHATRHPEVTKIEAVRNYIEQGASPRATLALFQAAKAHAFLKKRQFVIPDDIKKVAPKILGHRITPSYHAEAEQIDRESIIQTILTVVPCP